MADDVSASPEDHIWMKIPRPEHELNHENSLYFPRDPEFDETKQFPSSCAIRQVLS